MLPGSFQSPQLTGAATCLRSAWLTTSSYFNPRSSQELRPGSSRSARRAKRISIPAAHRSCDLQAQGVADDAADISIPAAHRSCDCRLIWLRAVRRISIPAAHRSCDISSGSILSSSKIISIPAAHRSCDSRTSRRTRTTPDFNPRSSQELRRRAQSAVVVPAIRFQSPQLTGAATEATHPRGCAAVKFQSPQLTGAATGLGRSPAVRCA